MKNQVGIVKCKDYNSELVYENTKELLNKIGGISSFIKQGEKVLLKPNILMGFSPEKCVNTHPSVVEAVARLVKEAGGKVFLGDSPGAGSTKTHSKKAGYNEIAEKVGFEIVEFNKPKKFSNPNGVLYKSFEIDENIKSYDKLINLPKFKTHAMMYMTLAIKNMYGAVVGIDKMQWHIVAGRDYSAFAKFLIELYNFANPVLNILDGIVGMEGNGPQSGQPREIGVILASRDGLSIDRVACEIVGINSKNVPIFQAAKELGFNSFELDNIEIIGEKISDVEIKHFKTSRVSSLMGINAPKSIEKVADRLMTVRPKINHIPCTRCKICDKHCPVKAIDMISYPKIKEKYNGYMKIDYEKCIRCFCCQEMCPNNAISVKESFLVKSLSKILQKW